MILKHFGRNIEMAHTEIVVMLRHKSCGTSRYMISR